MLVNDKAYVLILKDDVSREDYSDKVSCSKSVDISQSPVLCHILNDGRSRCLRLARKYGNDFIGSLFFNSFRLIGCLLQGFKIRLEIR